MENMSKAKVYRRPPTALDEASPNAGEATASLGCWARVPLATPFLPVCPPPKSMRHQKVSAWSQQMFLSKHQDSPPKAQAHLPQPQTPKKTSHHLPLALGYWKTEKLIRSARRVPAQNLQKLNLLRVETMCGQAVLNCRLGELQQSSSQA